MKTKQYLILTFALFLFSTSQAQQEILYTQYVFSQLAVNPACAGNDDGLSFTALSRKQWFGLQGSPTSFSISTSIVLRWLWFVIQVNMAKIELDIIVVGAGIAGLSAAISLSRAGHNVTVCLTVDHIGR